MFSLLPLFLSSKFYFLFTPSRAIRKNQGDLGGAGTTGCVRFEDVDVRYKYDCKIRRYMPVFCVLVSSYNGNMCSVCVCVFVFVFVFVCLCMLCVCLYMCVFCVFIIIISYLRTFAVVLKYTCKIRKQTHYLKRGK